MRRKERDPATTAYRFRLDPPHLHYCDVRVLAERGRVLDFTVIYLATVGDRVYPVMRYDTAHGDPHRDTLDWDGHVVEKHWMPGMFYALALNNAIREVKTTWEDMFADFLRRRPIR
jgi:hypothetical protein